MSIFDVSTPLNAGRTVLVGIDEAGYGPLLGPLVVSAVAFAVPSACMPAGSDTAEGPDLWAMLQASVARKHGRRDPRLAVADSKKLHGSTGDKAGVRLLERAALSFLGTLGEPPATWRQLSEQLCPAVAQQIAEHPWYAAGDLALPREATPGDLATQCGALRRDLQQTGVRFLGACSEVLCEAAYNRIVARTDNKAVVLFNAAARLMLRIGKLVDSVGGSRDPSNRTSGPERQSSTPPVVFCVDRQGGRTGYRRPLMTAFDDAQLDELAESDERSSYRLSWPDRRWCIHFIQQGESAHLPIALASVFSKYLRELFMARFNAWWAELVPGLRPTAGYYQDGQRFLADIAPALQRLSLDPRLLIRQL